MVDDEDYTMADHRDALRRAGHTVVGLTRLDDAVAMLEVSFSGGTNHSPFDVVLIDLMSGQVSPQCLVNSYQGISTRQNNQGQALGQWLWESAGARAQVSRPIHCYFTNVPEAYCSHSDFLRQEFNIPPVNPFDLQSAHKFILLKFKILPSKLSLELERIRQDWAPFMSVNLPLVSLPAMGSNVP